MKKIDWSKTAKWAGIILVIALVVLYFNNRDNQRQAKIEKYASDLSYVSEELSALKSYCEDAEKYEDYEDLCISMCHVQEKCEELQGIIDTAYDFYKPSEPDYEENKRSWLY